MNEQAIRDPESCVGHRCAGQRLWFEYHCSESADSADAEVWYRSHQQVTVLGEVVEHDGDSGSPVAYQVRFDDGLEWTVFDDELLDSPDEFSRPAPPKRRAS